MQDPTYVHQAFTEIAPKYVAANHVLSLGIDKLWRAKVARIAAQQNAKEILDLATGSGDLAAAVAKKLPNATIIAADFCEPMLEEARKRGIPNLMVADGTDLPFQSEKFDLVTVGFGLRNMADWAKAASEMARVIKPGGRLLLLDFSLPSNPLIRSGYRFYLHHVLPLVAGMITGKRHAYQYLGGSIEKFPSGQIMCQFLCQHGFATARDFRLSAGVASIYEAQK